MLNTSSPQFLSRTTFFFGPSQDPLETIRAKCEETEHCVHYKERLEVCEARVNSRSDTTEECTEELFDFLHARDHCVSVCMRHEENANGQKYNAPLVFLLKDTRSDYFLMLDL